MRVPAHEDELHRAESVGVGYDLRHDGEPRGDLLRGQGPEVGAVEVDVPALHAKHAGNGSQEGGLARAVGANQPHHLPVGRMQVCAVKQRFGLNLKEDALRANCGWPAVFHHCLLRKAECGRGWVGEGVGPEQAGQILGATDVPVGERREVLALDHVDTAVLDGRDFGEGLVS